MNDGTEVGKILISACLLGKRVRYDGNTLSVSDSILKQWIAQGRVVSVCPEVDAGMSIPRAPAEISKGDGHSVWAGAAFVVQNNGVDVTASFRNGAQVALALCQEHNICVAVLAENSPSCGSSMIYDGNFTDRKIAGVGVTTALLEKNRVEVFSQHNIQSADAALQRMGR